jgi:hypothetical protein
LVDYNSYIRWPARLRSSRPGIVAHVKIPLSSKARDTYTTYTDRKSSVVVSAPPGDEQMWDAEHWETLVSGDDFSWKAIALEVIK